MQLKHNPEHIFGMVQNVNTRQLAAMAGGGLSIFQLGLHLVLDFGQR